MKKIFIVYFWSKHNESNFYDIFYCKDGELNKIITNIDGYKPTKIFSCKRNRLMFWKKVYDIALKEKLTLSKKFDSHFIEQSLITDFLIFNNDKGKSN